MNSKDIGKSPKDCKDCNSTQKNTQTSLVLKSPSQKELALAKQSASSSDSSIVTDPASQLRSTLAIGQLIASNRPTAGNRLIAGEIRQLTKAVQEESSSLRKEIANLATSFKTILEDERERNNAATSSLARRPMFGPFANRRFPVYRRPNRRIPLNLRKSIGTSTNAASSTSPLHVSSPGSSAATKESTELDSARKSEIVQKHGASKSPVVLKSAKTLDSSSAKAVASTSVKTPVSTGAKSTKSFKDTLEMLLSRSWPNARDYDGEADTDSSDTTPASSP